MKTVKPFKIATISVMVLGIIHILATPIVLLQLKSLPPDVILCFAYMFVFTGIFILTLGWLQCFVLNRLPEHPLFIALLKASVVLVTIAGVGAVAAMWDNPFAYLILFVALYQCFLLRRLSGEKEELSLSKQ